MPGYDFTKFVKRITLQRTIPLQKIYAAWTTQEGMESWFLRLAEFSNANGEKRRPNEPVRTGDTYKWLWFGYDDTTGEVSSVLDTNNKDMFRFGFSGGCIVTVTIKEENNETICELVQQMPMDNKEEQQYFYIECGKGWTFYMANLKSVLEGGVDLRNKNAGIGNVINA